jgi:transposase
MSTRKTPASPTPSGATPAVVRTREVLVDAVLPKPARPIVKAPQAAAPSEPEAARSPGQRQKAKATSSTVSAAAPSPGPKNPSPEPTSRHRGRRQTRKEAEQHRQAKTRQRQQRQRRARLAEKAAQEAQAQAEAQSRMTTLPVVHAKPAGIDVGDASHWVCVGIDPQGRGHCREFSAMTSGLRELVAWLRQCAVTTVALEATGIYSHILFLTLLEAGFAVVMVSPQFTRQIKGRPKTDKRDCQWIYRLHRVGLLPSVFQPDEATHTLRDYVRQRGNHVRLSAQHVQRLQKALELMNLKLTKVLGDVTGVTGLKIIRAILAGERDPRKLAQRRDCRCRHDEAEIAEALDGRYRPEHLLELELCLTLWEKYQQVIRKLDGAIAQQLAKMRLDRKLPSLPPKTRKRGHKPHDPQFDVRTALYYLTGVDLTTIEGIDEINALVILSEIGTDMTKWPTVKHFCSWLGLCPNWKKTGGKLKASQTRRGKNRAATALRLAAFSLIRSKGYLGAYVRRQRTRLGAPKAITAGAHKLARIIYNLLRFGLAYVQKSEEDYVALTRARQLKSLQRKARELGFELKEIPGSAEPATAARAATM